MKTNKIYFEITNEEIDILNNNLKNEIFKDLFCNDDSEY